MTCREYSGNIITFRKGRRIGKGGNGGVYEIEVLSGDMPKDLVVKILHYIDQQRIERFRREIKVLIDLTNEGIEGIMPVIDYKCPEEIKKDDEIWYVMERAVPFSIRKQKEMRKTFLCVLSDMLLLAKTISVLHQRGIAHRDIKPDNILIRDNRFVLTDFGLVWTINGDRLTQRNERLGPYKIMPPELENYDGETDIQYMPTDVYLFAKVLWMMIKNDDNGFRGEYNRGDEQIYLDRKKMQLSVQTIEPIHKLLEKATKSNMNERITIDQCIVYIEEQIQIITGDMSEDLIKNNCFDEQINKCKAGIMPDSMVVEDIIKIHDEIKKLLSLSSVIIQTEVRQKKPLQSQGQNEDIDSKLLKVDDCKIVSEREMDLIQYRENKDPIFFRMYVDEMRIDMNCNKIHIKIQNIYETTGNVISWKEYCANPTRQCRYVRLGETEKVTIWKPVP